MRRPLLIGILALGLFACSEDDSVTGTEGSPSDTASIRDTASVRDTVAARDTATVPDTSAIHAAHVARFAVVDTVQGNWKVAASDRMYPGVSVRITKDSLIWEKTTIKTLRPDGKGKRFYAHGGRMGLTDGVSASDSVLFEYYKKGDTLWMEYQFTTVLDGKLDRTSPFSHALLPAP